MRKKKKIFLIVGRTCSGKDTCVDYACKKLNLKKLISYTTRPKREGEKDTHIFISPEKVNDFKNDIIAYTKIGDYEYFATEQLLDNCSFYIIDPKGIYCLFKNKALLSKYDFRICYFFVTKETQIERCIKRQDQKNAFIERCLAEDKSFSLFEERMLNNFINGYVLDAGKEQSKENFILYLQDEMMY